MRKRMNLSVLRRGRRVPQTAKEPFPTERASGEEGVRTREQQDAEATPSDMTRLKTARL